MGFLIIINFLLSLIAIFATIILFNRQTKFTELEKKYKQLNEQFEDSMSSFFMQMQEENEKFIRKLKEMKSESEPFEQVSEKNQPSSIENSERIQQFENNIYNDSISIKSPPLYSGVKMYQQMLNMNSEKEAGNYANDSLVNKDDGKVKNTEIKNDEIDRHEVLNPHDLEIKQIKELLMAGETVETIAKRLDKGKTEVELLIKFSPELREIQTH
ncbi:hypothetical protein [Pallidibacillus pasinlerensis]|uniref:Coupling factor for flagellin transcription and translation n=1 Tax=Pallidibacillus pasinlerensis TaxID=2703818 RepID=A0ABW9ZZA8_9BACI|nr:hypothetical protein [Pallidibacillus pasinlerensis]NCU16505.1 hypothetical protein [Pallidibacillus pasinlerensis]